MTGLGRVSGGLQLLIFAASLGPVLPCVLPPAPCPARPAEEAMRKRAEEQLSAATAALVTQGNIEAEREAARLKAEREAAEAAEAAEAERLQVGGSVGRWLLW